MRLQELGIALMALLLVAVAGAGILYRLLVYMPGASYGAAPPRSNGETADLAARLQAHVRVLAHDVGERHYWKPANMRAAADFIEQTLRKSGYNPVRHTVVTGDQAFPNIEVQIPGFSRAHEVMVVGAHYDTVRGSPGADDNASGVAVLLELARLLRGADLDRTIHLVAFANEEEPFHGTEAMGSLQFARRARAANQNIVGMISLEMLGYYTTGPDTQRYPAFLGHLYPHQGDFLAFVGNFASRQLVYDVIRGFRQYATVPSEGLAAPEMLEDILRSDHAAFWQMGYSAMMLTDTANFRNPHYHGPNDTYDTLDYATMARVTVALARLLRAPAGGTGSREQ